MDTDEINLQIVNPPKNLTNCIINIFHDQLLDSTKIFDVFVSSTRSTMEPFELASQRSLTPRHACATAAVSVRGTWREKDDETQKHRGEIGWCKVGNATKALEVVGSLISHW